MSELKSREFKKMTLDEAIACRMTKEQEVARLELMGIWINQRDD